jgi:hypothetical protein
MRMARHCILTELASVSQPALKRQITGAPHSLEFILGNIPRGDGSGEERLTQEEFIAKASEMGLPLTSPQPSPVPAPAPAAAPKGRATAAPKAAPRGKKAAAAAAAAAAKEEGKADHKADRFAAADAAKAAASPAKRKGGDKPMPAAKK